MNREFDTPITLIYMDGQQSEFFVLFDKEKYTVLRGLNGRSHLALAELILMLILVWSFQAEKTS